MELIITSDMTKGWEDPSLLPESVKRYMPTEERRRDKHLRTIEDIESDTAIKEERDMHEKFMQWLNLNEIYYLQSRMDKKSTIRKGQPDFCITHQGYAVHIEFKYGDNIPSEAQITCIGDIMRGGTPVHVCFSVADAIAKTRRAVLDRPPLAIDK